MTQNAKQIGGKDIGEIIFLLNHLIDLIEYEIPDADLEYGDADASVKAQKMIEYLKEVQND